MNPLPLYTRRDALRLGATASAAAVFAPHVTFSAPADNAVSSGAIVGHPIAAQVGEKVLRAGGNAIDAAIAAAFAAGVVAPHQCGIGGYGGHAVIALAGGKKITAIDFNTTAPAAARPDMFPLDAGGKVAGNRHNVGWLSAGVPGTLAGLELALTRYGTRSLRDTLAPVIALCESGDYAPLFRGADPGAKAAAPGEKSATPADLRRNAALTALFKTLAARNSGESFYRGDLAGKIATGFKQNGGLVTAADLAAYRARELAPLTLELWNGMTLHTAPLPATGLMLLEALAALKALDWPNLPIPARLHAKLEALRVAWAGRFANFGDPDHVKVPVEKLLSRAHASASAEKISAAIKSGKPVPLDVEPSLAGGTIHLSAGDRHGNLIALTLTHGNGFGARVLVEELGMVLGHGMSRFDPRPGRPNSPGPGKRPITNMCPSIVTRNGTPVFAVGGAGGTRIPNSVYEVLLQTAGLGASLDVALAAPRIDTNGTLAITLEKTHTAEDEAFLRQLGYKVARGGTANISATTFDPKSSQTRALSRG